MNVTLTLRLYAAALLVAVAFALFLARRVSGRRSAPGAGAFAIQLLGIALWCFCSALELLLPALQAKLFFSALHYLAIGITTVAYVAFVVEFTRERRVSPWLLALAAVVPMLTTLLAFTNAQHRWIYAETALASFRGFGHLQITPGPWYWYGIFYSYALFGVATLLVVPALLRPARLRRRQHAALLLAALLPAGLNMLYLTGLGDRALPIDLTPAGFVLSAILIAWGLFRRGLLDLTPVARDIVVEEMSDSLILMDNGGRILDMNPAAQRLTGSSLAHALGATLEQVLPEAASMVSRLIAEGTAERSELEIELEREGRRFWYELRASPIHWRGRRAVGLLLVIRDVTSRIVAVHEIAEARDEAMAADRAKSDFLATMSHEIRTPMNGIIGMTEILLDTPLGVEEREYAERVHANALGLLNILNDILDFSKVEAGHMELEPRAFDLREVVEDTLDLIAAKAQAKGLEVACLISKALPRTVVGDAGRIRQILLNLLANAVKFTASGEIVVRLLEREREGSAVVLRGEVSDTGIGIPAEFQNLLFRPFSQVDSSDACLYGGTGLGLAIVRRLVDLMGGEVGLRSVKGRGSLFWFTLRLEVATQDILPTLRAPWPEGLRALAIDDSAPVRLQLEEQLRRLGFEVDTASSVREGLECLRAASAVERHYAVALVDENLGADDGLSFAAAVRADPELLAPPMILLSRLNGEPTRTEAWTAAGFVAMLTKPVRCRLLRARLASILAAPRGTPEQPAGLFP